MYLERCVSERVYMSIHSAILHHEKQMEEIFGG